MSASGDLMAAAEAAADCLAVGATDRVLVLCNERERAVAEVLLTVAESRTRAVRLLQYPTLRRNGEEPPDDVAQAMRDASVVFATTTYSLSHTQARLAATAAGARIASMRGFTEAFAQAMSVDYARLRTAGIGLADALTAADSCRITSAAGTDVTLRVEGRCATADDGGLADYGLLRTPLHVRLEAGRAVDAQGEAADWLLSTLDAGGEHGRSIAEIGIGTNPGAKLCGLVAVDEKVLGTAHLAFGTSASFGGVNQASVHIDGMIQNPTVELDGRALPLVRTNRAFGGAVAD